MLEPSNFYCPPAKPGVYLKEIKHSELIKRLKNKVRHSKILSLIEKAIRTPSVIKSSTLDNPCNIGVPQGLSISNILASIYLINIDRKYQGLNNIGYCRYVDDVLILCKHDEVEKITKDFIGRCKKIGLTIHDPKIANGKSCIGKIGTPFGYLGYHFEDKKISIREESITRFKESIVGIFTAFKYSKSKNFKYLAWKLNLRITGCVHNSKDKGWLYYYSEINDESLLHKIDHYIKNVSKRFNVDVKLKTLVRTFYQIKHNKYQTSYIPNFDKFNLSEKKVFLRDIFSQNIAIFQKEEIELEFRKVIDTQVKDILADIRKIGY